MIRYLDVMVGSAAWNKLLIVKHSWQLQEMWNIPDCRSSIAPGVVRKFRRMISLIFAFLLGCLWTRTYYARVRSDWMQSSTWSKNALYRKLHALNCELCPKHWYCERYVDNNKVKEVDNKLTSEVWNEIFKENNIIHNTGNDRVFLRCDSRNVSVFSMDGFTSPAIGLHIWRSAIVKKGDVVKIKELEVIKSKMIDVRDILCFATPMRLYCGETVTLRKKYSNTFPMRSNKVWLVLENTWLWHEDWLISSFLTDEDFEIWNFSEFCV